MVKTVANMSFSEIDNQIRIYSGKIYELQELTAKITGRKFYKIGAEPKVDKKSAEYK